MKADPAVVRALARLAADDPDGASRSLVGSPGRLAGELAEHLAARHDGQVYEDPVGFQAFIDGGGNVALYRALAARLAAHYREVGADSVLDLGCGDGRALLAAAAQSAPPAPAFALVEPSPALLATAVAAARKAGLTVTAHPGTAQDFLDHRPPRRWPLAEATFSLHAIPPAERTRVLIGLRAVADAIMVVEFDVPSFDDGSLSHLTYLAQRYERGVAEYDGGPASQGFLMPVLVGQVQPGRVRNTWEQPATAWADQLDAAGWTDTVVEPLADYWWAPAVAITARR